MSVFIRNYTGELISLSQNTTVNGIKDAIWKRLGIYPNDQRLIFAGKQLDDNVYKVPTGSIVDLSLRLCGGRNPNAKPSGSITSATSGPGSRRGASTQASLPKDTTGKKVKRDCAGRWDDPPCPSGCGKSASSVNKTWVTTVTPKHGGRACPSSPVAKACPAT